MATINPFQGPANYAIDVQSPFESALGGFKLGAGMAEVQAAQQKRDIELKALQQAQQRQTEIVELYKNPKATIENFRPLLPFLPKDQALQITANFEAQTKKEQDETLDIGGRIYSALTSNRPDIAKSLIIQKAEGLRNSGKEKEAASYDDAANFVDIDPVFARNTILSTMARLPGGEQYLTNVDKALGTIRTEAKAPAELKKANADADKAVADATTAQAQAKNAPEKAAADAALARAQSEKAAVEAKYAERTAIDKIIADAAGLGLTKAQTNKVLVETGKLGIESKKAALELEALKATGGVDPEKKFTQEEKIRKEYQTRTKVYGELGTTFSNIESSAKVQTGPGDIALITSFMKMLDPGSVVRETEFATARDTAGLYTRLENSLKKAESGQFLQANQRKEFVDLAKQYLDSAQKKAGDDKKALAVVVKNYKLNPENVFGPEDKPPTPLPTSATIGGKTYSKPANFTDAQWGDYLKANGVIQ
jgi:hypothetical protein